MHDYLPRPKGNSKHPVRSSPGPLLNTDLCGSSFLDFTNLVMKGIGFYATVVRPEGQIAVTAR